MPKYFIHIGLQKTGSSFLQQQFFPAYDNLRYLSRPFTQYNHEFNRLQYADDSLYDARAFKSTLENFSEEKILISDENLAGKVFGYSYINRSMIANRLQKATTGGETEVIIFIRGQKEMMKSLYNQWVKSHLHGDRPVDDFFWFPKMNFLPSDLDKLGNGNERLPLDYLYYNTNKYYIHLDSFLYFPLIKLYKSLFKKVHVIPYESLKSDPENVFANLDSIIGERRSVPVDKSLKVNSSIADVSLPRKVFLNRYRNITNKVPGAFRVLNWISTMSRTKNREFLRNYERSIENLSAYYVTDNKRIIAEYPEIGIQDYPLDYALDK